MPDQRVIESTLGDVIAALESVGEQRPPGLLVVGWAVLALWGEGDTRVLEDDEGSDEERVKKWLSVGGGSSTERTAWRVREGLKDGWSDL
jgi:uroporphyrin-III C-methyltransferase